MLGLAFPVIVVLVLIIINGLFSMAEIALVSSRRIRLQQRAESGSKGAQAALDLLKQPTQFLSTAQIGITLVAILSGAYGEASISQYTTRWLEDAGLSANLADLVSTAVVVLCIVYLSIVLGELVPKAIGLQRAEVIAAGVARPMSLLASAAAPAVSLLSATSGAILRLIGIKNSDESVLTEEEIRLLIGQSAESGSVAEAEAELIDRVFHFGDRQVHEVMTARTDTVWLPADATVADFYAVFAQTPHSRFPVAEESLDHVTGILVIKDMLTHLAGGGITSESPITGLVRPAFFVPETKAIGELLREMQFSGSQMAIAVDEFGGTAGIVTLEQLLEEMVGQVSDELRPGSTEFKRIDDLTMDVDGSLSVEEARSELEIDFPEGPYDTIAGYVLNELGHIPDEGEEVSVQGHRITVIEMKGPKIETLRVTTEGAVPT